MKGLVKSDIFTNYLVFTSHSDVPGTVGPPRDEKRDDVVVNLVDEEVKSPVTCHM